MDVTSLKTLNDTKEYVAAHGAPVLPLWSLEPSLYDFHTAQEGSCLGFLRVLKNLQVLRVVPTIEITLTKSNYHELPRMIRFLQQSGLHHLRLVVPATFRDPSWFPQYGLLGDVLEELAPQWRDTYVIHGIPLCFVPEELRSSVAPLPELEGERIFLTPCDACVLQNRCSGVSTQYISYYRMPKVVPQD